MPWSRRSERSSGASTLPLQIPDLFTEFVEPLFDLRSICCSHAPELEFDDGPRLNFREAVPVHERPVGSAGICSSEHDVEDGVRVACRDGDGLVDVQLPKNVLQDFLRAELRIPVRHVAQRATSEVP